MPMSSMIMLWLMASVSQPVMPINMLKVYSRSVEMIIPLLPTKSSQEEWCLTLINKRAGSPSWLTSRTDRSRFSANMGVLCLLEWLYN